MEMQEKKDGTNTQASEKKRATNRDVAKLAGVSVATVSYVMNDRKDQHITEATKKKVYQAMNILNYAPNHYAVGLNTKQRQSIAVRSSEHISLLSEVALLYFLRDFRPICEANGYQLLYSLEKSPIQIATCACLCFDMPDEEFHALANENYIPVVAIDSLINDPLFYQVNVDYKKMRTAAERYFGDETFTYVCITPANTNVRREIERTFSSVVFVSQIDDLPNRIAAHRNILLTQRPLYSALVAATDKNILRYDAHLTYRAQAVYDCVQKALNRENLSPEEHFIIM